MESAHACGEACALARMLPCTVSFGLACRAACVRSVFEAHSHAGSLADLHASISARIQARKHARMHVCMNDSCFSWLSGTARLLHARFDYRETRQFFTGI